MISDEEPVGVTVHSCHRDGHGHPALASESAAAVRDSRGRGRVTCHSTLWPPTGQLELGSVFGITFNTLV